ncbi:TonB-dependent receptor P26 [Dyadobacter sp. CECT 9275]|uniref:TonB-dependent receptor P26 n=1 Tax=Dyadobacter helix TaxID=2822344 RepID=A0A916JEP7_9BACT|nr:TonB-dependent receptor [Dyadobacter sp. CECT 9275]CAG5006244.1 TonB-dependent receptor P26 [Dyadobacter sp. CECT 9275]
MKENRLKTFTLLILLLLTFGSISLAQSLDVTGTVKDETGAVIPGATILVKSTTVGTATDENGAFSIKVPDQASVLVVSSVSYVTQEIIVGQKSVIDVVLAADVTQLSDVVVIGYGTQKKGDLTAPVSTINTDDMLKRTTATPMEALQGSVPGVQVVTSGSPGSSPSVRIRGIGSFNNSNPLYVVDGMFVDDIGFLNPNDIADMSVLKDASGAAIYGVRAANGVVIITTKKGKLNMKTRVTYNGYAGLQMPTNVPKMANGQQFAAYALEWRTPADSGSVRESVARYGGSGLNPSTSTDWYKNLLRKQALITNQGVDVQGGSDKVTYTAGFNYTYQNGVMEAKNDFRRYNFRLQMEAKAFSWLKLGFTSIFNNSTTHFPNNQAFLTAYTASPLFPVYDDKNVNAFPVKFANSGLIGRGDENAIAQAYYNFNRLKQFQILPSVYAEADFWENRLTFRSQLSQLYSSGLRANYVPQRSLGTAVLVSNLASTQERTTNYILDNLLTYRDGIGSHNWTVLLGQSSRQEQWRMTRVSADNVPADEEFWYTRQGTPNSAYYDEDGYRNRGVSFFARGTYDFDRKYLLTATFRADGSSKYQTKWGYFPSLGLGWVLSHENFMKDQDLFDFLKLRGSWGKLGNDGIRPNSGYASVTVGNQGSSIFGSTGTSNGQYVPGYTVNNFFANITWEVVTEWDFGIDFELLKNKLKGSVDYYNRKTSNVALERSFPFGAPNIYGNWASMENSGVDVSLSWNHQIGKLGYQIGANLSTLNNKVTDIGSLLNIPGGYSEWMAEFPNRIEVGQPIQYFYGYDVIGIYQNQQEIDADPVAVNANAAVPGTVQPGFFKYRDRNGNGIRDDGDRTFLGSYLPKVTYGFNASLTYGRFDFSVVFQGVAGNKIMNLNRGRYVKGQSSLNLDAEFYENLWTGPGSTNSYPSAFALSRSWNRPQGASFFVENGSYLRVQNVQLGYNFKIGDKSPVSMRVFATADRPLIFTKYSGFTPEISGIGYDANVYPISSTYSIGVRATF